MLLLGPESSAGAVARAITAGLEIVAETHSRSGELERDPNAGTTSLGALGRAFKGALERPRYFRSMVQWSAVWNRYAPAAIATGQLPWPQALAHLNQMFKLVEERNVIVVIVRQWCSCMMSC